MKICIKKNEFNPSFIALYGEEKAKEQGYTIVEPPQGCEDCAFEDFNEDYTFDIEKYNKRKQGYENQKILRELTNWFNSYFDKQLNQSLWQDDFSVSHDDYFDKDYANIDELKAQAKIVRDEIRELRENV